MHGNWIYLEKLPEKFLESDISSNLETEGVTKQAPHVCIRLDPWIKSSEGETVIYKDS